MGVGSCLGRAVFILVRRILVAILLFIFVEQGGCLRHRGDFGRVLSRGVADRPTYLVGHVGVVDQNVGRRLVTIVDGRAHVLIVLWQRPLIGPRHLRARGILLHAQFLVGL